VIRLESSALLVDVLPEVGGKIGQIRDKASGCDLLIPPQRPYRTILLDGDWLQHDTSGMDDCFPNVAAGAYPESPWNSASLPDLGEWTHSAWKVKKTRATEIVMEKAGHALPYLAVKTIHFADKQTLEFSYSVENQGQFPLRYLWSAHPLIGVQDAYELLLPQGDLTFEIFPPNGDVYRWPSLGERKISSEWIPHGTTLKIFVMGLSEGWCTLALPVHLLRFTFDLRTLPVLGIWFNNFGFPRESGHPLRCIGVEPCTSPSDLLDNLEPAAYPRIAPGETARWSMQLTILPHESPEAQ
jgi:hypothetical protein